MNASSSSVGHFASSHVFTGFGAPGDAQESTPASVRILARSHLAEALRTAIKRAGDCMAMVGKKSDVDGSALAAAREFLALANDLVTKGSN